LLELVLRKFFPRLYQDLGVYLPLITVNCAVLGAALLNSSEQRGFVDSAAAGLGTGLGYFGVMVIFAGLRERLSRASVPKAFAGTPVAFLTAGILALAIMGFDGLGK
jgi:electron transport complex protein RnfA